MGANRPQASERARLGFADERLARLRSLHVEPIVTLTHHGSGPKYTSLLDDRFASGLAAHARAVAERYPWVGMYTPVNEPLTTARFSGLYGHWYPHGRDNRTFTRALLNETWATVLSMAEVRKVNPNARLVQTEDLGKTHSTVPLAYQAEHENLRRWITWDLLCGMVDREHGMWDVLVRDGIGEEELDALRANACPPDIIGVNHYLISERFLDHCLEHYPERVHGGNGRDAYADVEAVRVLAGGVDGFDGLLRETWERYGLPIAITECHLGCTREEQARWLAQTWQAAQAVREAGVDVRAVTVWSLFGAYDWCSLLTRDANEYEPGVFDLRAPEPRPTALAAVARALAAGDELPHEAFEDLGWWERPIRLEYEPVMAGGRLSAPPAKEQARARRPLLILGANGDLGSAFARLCELRGLEHRLVKPEEVASVTDFLDEIGPWAVVNAAGTLDADAAEHDPSGCWKTNAATSVRLAVACAGRGIPLASFSSGMVFDGTKESAYVEDDRPRPLNVLGETKLGAEVGALRAHPESLVIRSGPLFGPWSHRERLADIVATLREGRPYETAGDVRASHTYVPDLVNATLDLLLDGVVGKVHLASGGGASWAGFARSVAKVVELDPDRVEARPVADLGWAAPRPRNQTLASERASVMPSLENALERLAHELDLREGGEPEPRFCMR